MSERITEHQVDDAKTNVEIIAENRDLYLVIFPTGGQIAVDFSTGLTNEALIAIVRHRLGLQGAEVFDGLSGGARMHFFRGLAQLKERTRDRVQRGVEGQRVR